MFKYYKTGTKAEIQAVQKAFVQDFSPIPCIGANSKDKRVVVVCQPLDGLTQEKVNIFTERAIKCCDHLQNITISK